VQVTLSEKWPSLKTGALRASCASRPGGFERTRAGNRPGHETGGIPLPACDSACCRQGRQDSNLQPRFWRRRKIGLTETYIQTAWHELGQ
jgi:hypothetical protein